jgi:hypothetical protein
MSICGGIFSLFSTFGQSYESCLSSNGTYFVVSKPIFSSVNLITYYNNLTTFSLTTISYLDCLIIRKPNDQDLSSIDADKCGLKPNANATQFL